jgi:ABC-type multidrug transport system ATPase subunit
MKLIKIKIQNYRSIDEIDLSCVRDGEDSTFGLIGLNEAGKSSILRAIDLFGSKTSITIKDFLKVDSNIRIEFHYQIDEADESWFKNYIIENAKDTIELNDFNTEEVIFACEFTRTSLGRENFIDLTNLSTKETHSVTLSNIPIDKLHRPVFWTAEDRFLISKAIDLNAFAANPEAVSIPLRNCFLLAGIENIPDRIALMKQDSTEVEELAITLGTAVTSHIKSVWPEHPISISFLINNEHINFHIKDTDASVKAKTADQRSDGFRQFISFLLTVSAQNRNEELSNTILLLDEPETHLHPLAQENLLQEFIKITSNDHGNIVFFATHSNYLIDKSDLSRNLEVKKIKSATTLNKFDPKSSSYASVTYDVFHIASTDYHNELYGLLHERFAEANQEEAQRSQIKYFDEHYFFADKKLKKNHPFKGVENSATLPTYIRNCIHHPDNGDKFNDEMLRKSIETMRSFLI